MAIICLPFMTVREVMMDVDSNFVCLLELGVWPGHDSDAATQGILKADELELLVSWQFRPSLAGQVRTASDLKADSRLSSLSEDKNALYVHTHHKNELSEVIKGVKHALSCAHCKQTCTEKGRTPLYQLCWRSHICWLGHSGVCLCRCCQT